MPVTGTGRAGRFGEMSETSSDIYNATILGPLLFGSTAPTVGYTPEAYQLDRGAAELGGARRMPGGQLLSGEDVYRNLLRRDVVEGAHRFDQAYRGTGGPQVQGPDLSSAQDTRAQVLRAAQNAGSVARGAQQGAGERAMADATKRQIGTARSIALSQAGMSPAARLRAAQEAGSRIGTEGARQAGNIAAQEQQAARQAQLQGLSGVLGQDVQSAQLGQQANLANLQARMQQMQMAQQGRQQALGQALGMEAGTAGRRVALEQAQAQAYGAEQARALQAAIANQQATAQASSGGIFGLFG